jgi:PPOX class probable F420-dependent enzyme
MELSEAIEYVRENRQGVLTSQKRDGRPQLSNIVYLVTADGQIQISATADRAKTRNLMRDPRASLHVTDENFGAYCVIEGDVTCLPEAADPHDSTVDALVDWYRAMGGEHPDWEEYRRAMVTERRLLLQFAPSRAYGMLSR